MFVYAAFAPEEYAFFIIGIGLAAIIQGIGAKLLFSFLAEVVICLHAVAPGQPSQSSGTARENSFDDALGISA